MILMDCFFKVVTSLQCSGQVLKLKAHLWKCEELRGLYSSGTGKVIVSRKKPGVKVWGPRVETQQVEQVELCSSIASASGEVAQNFSKGI